MSPGTHVLLVSQAPGVSGGERAVIPTLASLKHLRVTVAGREPVYRFARECGLDATLLEVPRARRLLHASRVLNGALSIRRLAARLRADVVYANGGRAIVPAVAARVVGGPPLLAHHHGQMGGGSKRAYVAGIRRWADLIVVDSTWSAGPFGSSPKVSVVHNGIDLDRFRPASDRYGAKEGLGLPGGAPVVGMLARSSAGKGADAFLDLVEGVTKQVPGAHFVLAGGPTFPGEDTMFERISRRAASYGGRVKVTGYLSDPRTALHGMDVFVHLGEPEGLSLALLEAWATGLPVVANAWGAIGDAIDDSETGFCVEPGNSADAADAVASILRDPELRRTMSLAARAHAEKDYGITRMAADLAAAIAQLAD